jgi:Fe-S cluster assembly protein SufD
MSNALTQYLELYRAQRATIHGHSPAALNALRPAALQSLEATPLPRKGQEDYEAFDLEAVLAPDYGVNINRLEFAGHDVDHGCTVPNLSTRLYTIVGDTFHASRPAHADDEVLVTSLAQAPEQLLAEHYGSVATLQRPIVALNTLLAQDGLLVHAPAGKVTHRPLQVVNIFNAAAPVMAVRRTLIVAEPGSHVQVLVCDHTQHAEQDYLSVQVVEIIAMEGATVEYYDMEESTPRTHRLSSLHVRQHEGSNVLVNGITLLNGITRNEYHISVDGPNASTTLLGMAIASGEQHVDTLSHIAHNAPRCKSDEMFKYVLDDHAVGAFAGKILVRENCPRVEAYQGNRNLCASSTARMHTKPQLEIYTDDVKCSHGTTIGQLDEEALFYMRSRGIGRELARTMLMQAFMSDIIDGVRLEVLRDRLRHLVEKRFAGDLATCAGCNLNKK